MISGAYETSAGTSWISCMMWLFGPCARAWPQNASMPSPMNRRNTAAAPRRVRNAATDCVTRLGIMGLNEGRPRGAAARTRGSSAAAPTGDKPAICITEPEAGSAATEMTTRAVRRGDEWVVDGVKHWITGGGVSRLHLIFARAIEEGQDRGRAKTISSGSATTSQAARRPLGVFHAGADPAG